MYYSKGVVVKYPIARLFEERNSPIPLLNSSGSASERSL